MSIPLKDQIKAARVSAGLTQDALAGRLGMVRQSVIGFEKGKPIKLEMICQIARITKSPFRLFDCVITPQKKKAERRPPEQVCFTFDGTHKSTVDQVAIVMKKSALSVTTRLLLSPGRRKRA